MPKNKKQVDFTRKEYLKNLRKSLPIRYQVLSDDQLYWLAQRRKPELAETEFKPEPLPEPSFTRALYETAVEYAYRTPEMAASAYNSLSMAARPDDPAAHKYRMDMYKWARQTTEKWTESDKSLQAFQQWAAENPVSWTNFFTSPALFGQVLSQAVTSMGTIMASGAIGSAIGGPAIGLAAVFSTGALLEGSEAYDQAYDRAKEKGMTDKEIDKTAAESFAIYGAVSGVLESLVPMSVLKSIGFSKMAAKGLFPRFASKYLAERAIGKTASIATTKKIVNELVEEGLGRFNRIKDLSRFIGLPSGTEAATELAQYLSEEAILDKKIDGRDIDVNWMMEKLASSEAAASFYGGWLGGGTFSIYPGLKRASGVNGIKYAQNLMKIRHRVEDSKRGYKGYKGEKAGEILLKDGIQSFLNDPQVGNTEKVAFAGEVAKMDATFYKEQIDKTKAPVEEAKKEEPKTPKESKKEKKTEKVSSKESEEKGPFQFIPKGEQGLEDRALNWYLQEKNPEKTLDKIDPDEKKAFESLVAASIKKHTGEEYSGPEIHKKVQRLKEKGFKVETEEGGLSGEIVTRLVQEEIERDIGDQVVSDVSDEIVDKIVNPSKEKGTGKRNQGKTVEQMNKELAEAAGQEESKKAKRQTGGIKTYTTKDKMSTVARGETKSKKGQEIVLKQINSGGALQADTGGLLGGKALGLITGGWAPKGWGRRNAKMVLETFGLKELTEGLEDVDPTTEEGAKKALRARTIKNVEDNDGTLIMGKKMSKGTVLTLNELERQGKPYIVNPTKEQFIEWLKANEIESLNVAGPHDEPGLEQKVRNFLISSLKGKVGKAAKKTTKKKKAPITPEKVQETKKKAAKARKEIQEERPSSPVDKKIEKEEKVTPKKSKQTQETKKTGPKDKTGTAPSLLEGPKLDELTVIPEDLDEDFMQETITDNSTNNVEFFHDLGFKFPFSYKKRKNYIFRDFGKDTIDAKIVLQKMINILHESVMSKEQKALARFFIKQLKRVPTSMVEIGYKDQNAAASWHPKTSRITLRPDFPLDQLVVNFLHEVGHTLTWRRLVYGSQNPDTAYGKIFYNINAVRETILRHYKKQDPEEYDVAYSYFVYGEKDAIKNSKYTYTHIRNRYYGLLGRGGRSGAVIELASEFWSNDRFRENLKRIIFPLKTWPTYFEKLKNLILQVLGFSGHKQSALYVLASELVEVMAYKNPPFSAINYDAYGKEIQDYQNGWLWTYEINENNEAETNKPSIESENEIFISAVSDRFVGDPGVAMKDFLIEKYNIYIPYGKYPELVKIAQKYKHKSFLDDNVFAEFLTEYENKLEEISGDKISKRNKNYRSFVKGWYQSVNSSIENNYARKWNLGKRNVIELIIDKDGAFLDKFEDHQKKKKIMYRALGPTPEMHRVTEKRNPGTSRTNFIEEEREYGSKIILLSLTDKMIFKRVFKKDDIKGTRPRYIQADRSQIKLNAANISRINRYFAREMYDDIEADADSKILLTFFAETKGDNSKLLFTYVPLELLGHDQKSFNEYIDLEVRKKLLHPKQAKLIMDTIGDPDPDNQHKYSQFLAVYETYKGIKGEDYFIHQMKDDNFNPKFTVMLVHKRLKLDLFEGIVVRGSGDIDVMVIDPKETFMTATDQYGKEHDISLFYKFDPTRYDFDGAMFTSAKTTGEMNKLLGSNAQSFKTVIRYLDPATKRDYINFKMMEMTPHEGMKVWKKGEGKTRELLAEYVNNEWRDAQGNTFKRLASVEERKESRGRFKATGEVLRNIPERAMRVSQIHDKSAFQSAFPIASQELMLDKEFFKNNPEATAYLNSVMKHIAKTGFEYMKEFFDLRRKPFEFRKKILQGLQEGSTPTDIQKAAMFDKTGKSLFLDQYMKLLIVMTRNRQITDGLLKMRNRQNSTHLNLKPPVGLQFNDEKSMFISADNITMLRVVAREYVKTLPEEARKEFMLLDDNVKIIQLNEYLAKNDLWMLVHRQPIQGFTKVQPRKLQGFVFGKHGQTAFLSSKDVFGLLEGDYDGDSVHIEFGNQEMIQSLVKMIWDEKGVMRPRFAKRDKYFKLEWFKKGKTGKSVLSFKERNQVINNNTTLHSLQGHSVSAKTIAAILAYKDFKFNYLSQRREGYVDGLPKGVFFQAFDPQDSVVINYFPLDYNENVRKEIEAQGDTVVKRGDNYYLKTTKENEFSILLQAAVDHEEYGLWTRVPGLRIAPRDGGGVHNFLLSRMFKRTDNGPITTNHYGILGDAYRAFNYSLDKRGENKTDGEISVGKTLEYPEIIQRSRELVERYFQVEELEAGKIYNIEDLVMNSTQAISDNLEAEIQNMAGINRKTFINNISMNNKITPTEWMIMQSYLYHLAFTQEAKRNGITLKTPLEITGSTYNIAHQYAMEDVSEQWIKEWRSDNVTKKEFAIIQEMVEEMGSSIWNEELNMYGFYALYERDLLNPEKPKFDRERAEIFFDHWFHKLHKNPLPKDVRRNIVLKWVSAKFLSGSRVDGVGPMASVVRRIPSPYLLHPGIHNQYAEKMYDRMFENEDERMEPSGLLTELRKTWSNCA